MLFLKNQTRVKKRDIPSSLQQALQIAEMVQYGGLWRAGDQKARTTTRLPDIASFLMCLHKLLAMLFKLNTIQVLYADGQRPKTRSMLTSKFD